LTHPPLLPYSDENSHRNKEGERSYPLLSLESPSLSAGWRIGRDLGWVRKCVKNFVIELEGEVHEYQRVLVLPGLRLTTLRIRNNELQDIDSVKGKILTCIR
jgi:hypothetical protein